MIFETFDQSIARSNRTVTHLHVENYSSEDLGTQYFRLYEQHGHIPEHLQIVGEMMRRLCPDWKYSGEYQKK